MADTKKMLDAIRKFEFYSHPANANSSAPCTVGDLENIISNLAKTLRVIVSELEKR